jgi:acetyltransferase-like isoleucine patch superfamily enzyme
MISKLWKVFKTRIDSKSLEFNNDNISSNIKIVSPSLIKCNKNNLMIGKDFFSGRGLYISVSEYVNLNIGDSVMFGPEIMVLGGNHDSSFTKSHMRYNDIEDPHAEDISIENGAWIGARCIILSGSNIGEGAIIGANSVVNKYIPPYCVAAGSPIKVIKSRFKTVAELELVLKNTSSLYQIEFLIKVHQRFGIIYDR